MSQEQQQIFPYLQRLLNGAPVEWKPLGEVCTKALKINWNKTEVGTKYQYIDLSSVDIRTSKIITTTTITPSDHPSRAQQIIQHNDILFGTTRPTQMRYCLVPKQYNAEICSTGYCVIRPDATITHPNYILHIISSKSFQDYVEQNQSGASYPSITDNCIRDFIIPIPPMEVQERIVEILDKFTELQAELQAELALREKQYIYFRDQLLSFEMLNRGGGIR